jgi:hypothetical protein
MATQAMLAEVELKMNGIQALNKALGHTGALRFLSLMGREPTDYVQISRKLYEGQTVDEIFHRAKDAWRKLKR